MGKNINATRNTINIMVNKKVSEAPCDDANRIGLFSFRFTKIEPIPKFRETSAKEIKPMLIAEIIYNCPGKFKCEK